MSNELIGGMGVLALLVLLLLRIPVAFAIFAVGFVGVSILASPGNALSLLASETYTVATSLKNVSESGFTLSIENLSADTYDATFNFIAITQ